MTYYCYLIVNENNRTYTGTTNNLEKRIDQHNNILKGGAKATKCSSQWKYHCAIDCVNKENALRFEWYFKHYKTKNNKWLRTKSGLINKVNRLEELLINDEFTNFVVKYY